MKLILNNKTLNETLRPFKDIGYVPTMGGIHKGHISLIKQSRKSCKKTIVSIFINPKQFNNKKDLKSYPSNIYNDISILKKNKDVDYVYVPKFKDIYRSEKKSTIKIKKNDKILCAKYRKGHFEGVLDVMDKLTDIIRPKKIFMGKKDFLQLFLVKNFIEKKYQTKVISCETIRDKNMVALSTRNYLLNKVELRIAGKIAKLLLMLKKKIKNKKNITYILLKQKKLMQENFGVKIQYLELRDEKKLKISNKTDKSRIFISYYLRDIRLIDNF